MHYTDLMLIKEDGEYLLSDNKLTGDSLRVSSFIVGSIRQANRFKADDGIVGRVDYGFSDEYRRARLIVEASAKDGADIALLRDAINDLFYGTFYVREMRLTFDNEEPVTYESIGKTTGDLELGKPQLVGGKQLNVRNVSEVVPSIDDTEFTFSVDLETVELPYLETSYTTQDLHKSGFSALVEKYGLADNIHIDYTKYTFTENQFEIWNAGNVIVDPRFCEMKIIVKGVTSTGNFRIDNLTTGEFFLFKEALSNQTLTLDGSKVLVGISNKLRDSNRKTISLKPGLNKLKISGGSFTDIAFDFKYYYK